MGVIAIGGDVSDSVEEAKPINTMTKMNINLTLMTSQHTLLPNILYLTFSQ